MQSHGLFETGNSVNIGTMEVNKTSANVTRFPFYPGGVFIKHLLHAVTDQAVETSLPAGISGITTAGKEQMWTVPQGVGDHLKVPN